ncbi:MAG: hypothetical protein AAF676_02585 [Pseudomonadota bacterium]
MQALYVHLPPGADPPEPPPRPYAAVVLVQADVSPAWRDEISRWLVETGCLYMMAWGRGCGAWDDAVDWANLEAFDYGPIPEDAFVMTTWHDGGTLDEVFDFAWHDARDPTQRLETTLILDIRDEPRREVILANLARAARSRS